MALCFPIKTNQLIKKFEFICFRYRLPIRWQKQNCGQINLKCTWLPVDMTTCNYMEKCIVPLVSSPSCTPTLNHKVISVPVPGALHLVPPSKPPSWSLKNWTRYKHCNPSIELQANLSEYKVLYMTTENGIFSSCQISTVCVCSGLLHGGGPDECNV